MVKRTWMWMMMRVTGVNKRLELLNLFSNWYPHTTSDVFDQN